MPEQSPAPPLPQILLTASINPNMDLRNSSQPFFNRPSSQPVGRDPRNVPIAPPPYTPTASNRPQTFFNNDIFLARKGERDDQTRERQQKLGLPVEGRFEIGPYALSLGRDAHILAGDGQRGQQEYLPSWRRSEEGNRDFFKSQTAEGKKRFTKQLFEDDCAHMDKLCFLWRYQDRFFVSTMVQHALTAISYSWHVIFLPGLRPEKSSSALARQKQDWRMDSNISLRGIHESAYRRVPGINVYSIPFRYGTTTGTKTAVRGD